jgi:hypothetical protein
VSVATASENEALPQLQPFRSQGHRGADKAICLYGEKRTLTPIKPRHSLQRELRTLTLKATK